MRRRPGDSGGGWIPNPRGGLMSFALEVFLVLVLALVSIAVGAVALLVF